MAVFSTMCPLFSLKVVSPLSCRRRPSLKAKPFSCLKNWDAQNIRNIRKHCYFWAKIRIKNCNENKQITLNSIDLQSSYNCWLDSLHWISNSKFPNSLLYLKAIGFHRLRRISLGILRISPLFCLYRYRFWLAFPDFCVYSV